jgi:hypothetical protein
MPSSPQLSAEGPFTLVAVDVEVEARAEGQIAGHTRSIGTGHVT